MGSCSAGNKTTCKDLHLKYSISDGDQINKQKGREGREAERVERVENRE